MQLPKRSIQRPLLQNQSYTFPIKESDNNYHPKQIIHNESGESQDGQQNDLRDKPDNKLQLTNNIFTLVVTRVGLSVTVWLNWMQVKI